MFTSDPRQTTALPCHLHIEAGGAEDASVGTGQRHTLWVMWGRGPWQSLQTLLTPAPDLGCLTPHFAPQFPPLTNGWMSMTGSPLGMESSSSDTAAVFLEPHLESAAHLSKELDSLGKCVYLV